MNKQERIESIIMACLAFDIYQKEQIQYVLATVEHETAGTYKPVKEAYWVKNAEAWRKRNLRYWPYYGRGLVQITWLANYEKFSELMNLDLVNNPDLVMEWQNSLFILCTGMKLGLFTGKKLNDYINDSKQDFIGARKIINGTDRAQHIAGLADRTEVTI